MSQKQNKNQQNTKEKNSPSSLNYAPQRKIKKVIGFLRRKMILVGFIVLLIALIILGGFLFYQFKKPNKISQEAKVQETTEVSLEEATLTIPAESLKEDTGVTLKTVKAPALKSQDLKYVSKAYEFTSSQPKFEQPVVLTIGYSPGDLPDSSKEENLYLAVWENGEWAPLKEGIINKKDHSLTAVIDHFSIFTILYDTVGSTVDTLFYAVIESKTYDELPEAIQLDLGNSNYSKSDVAFVHRIEVPLVGRASSLMIGLANAISYFSDILIGGAQGKEELIEATTEKIGKEIVKATGPEGELAVTIYETSEKIEIASNLIKIALKAKEAAELSPPVVYAKAAAWILEVEMDYINEHTEEAWKNLWKLNPTSLKKVETYLVHINDPYDKGGELLTRGTKYYYFDEGQQKYLSFYTNLVSSKVELKEIGAAPMLKNVALSANDGKATADSYGSYGGYTAYPEKANDGDNNTFWAGTDAPGWYQVEFDRIYKIEKIVVHTYYHTQTFYIELSQDGSSWTQAVSKTTTKDEKPSGEGENDSKEFSITPTEAKYIKVTITESDAPGSHIYQTALIELEAYTSEEVILAEEPTGKIAFVKTEKGATSPNIWLNHPNIWTVNADGSNLKQITTDNDSIDSCFLSDGRIAFAKHGDEPATMIIVVTNSDGNNPQEVVREYDLGISELACSPIENKIAYVTEEEEGTDIAVVEIGQKAENITNNPEVLNHSPSFSADGKRILFAKNHQTDPSRSPVSSIFSMNLDGSNQKLLVHDPLERYTGPILSPKGGLVFWRSGSETTSVGAGGLNNWLIKAKSDGLEKKRWGPDFGGVEKGYALWNVKNPDFSPDGQYLVFEVSANKVEPWNVSEPSPWENSIWVVPIDGGTAKKLIDNGQNPAW